METVEIEISRRRAVRGGDRFEVFGDRGTGVIDRIVPLTDRAMPYFEGLPVVRGHLLDGHLAGCHGDNVAPDGHLSGRHLAAEHLWPAETIFFVTRPLCFGVFRFAVGSVDGVGNRSVDIVEEVTRTVNSFPRPAASLGGATFDPASRRLSFALVPC